MNFFKLSVLMIAMISLTACSSSKVEEKTGSAESANQVLDESGVAEASTDQIPNNDLAALDAPSADMPESVVMENPQAPAPIADAPVPADGTPVVMEENQIAGEPVVAEANPVADLPAEPVADNSAIEPAPITENSPAAAEPYAANVGETTQYRVKKGDTLMKIAFEQYGDLYRWKEIYETNRANIQDPNHVPPGTKLSLNGAGMVSIERNGESYLIKRGDTLGVISNDVYGTTHKWKKLWENNRQLIKDPNRIYAGFYLYYIPEGKLTHDEAPAVLEESAAVAPKVSTAPREPASQQ